MGYLNLFSRLDLVLIIQLASIAIGFILLATIIFVVFLRKYIIRMKEIHGKTHQHIKRVGIFHPYSNGGGGGERVLWCAIRSLQQKYGNKIQITVYTGDLDVAPERMILNARNMFNVSVDIANIDFVYLHKRAWIEAEYYPRFTMLRQSLGSMVLAMEALLKYQPDIFLDTMGYAFTYPIFRYLGACKVGSYTHYPVVSTDMLKRVKNRIDAHNNPSYVAKNPFRTWLKLTYYRLFAKLYAFVGRSAITVMVNSSWTEKHILDLWNIPFSTHRVYPPCEVSHLRKLTHTQTDDIVILSVGQFRPEKDHPLQLQAMYELRSLLVNNEPLWNRLKLVIVGSCRNDEDRERKKNMEDLAKHLALENSVVIKSNISYQELVQTYQVASIGLHTMWNEHFGIGIVECMAAGLIMVANRSGGPLMDIIETSEGSQNGFLAMDAIDYAKCILHILQSTDEENEMIRVAARASCDRFSEEEFKNQFLRAVTQLFE